MSSDMLWTSESGLTDWTLRREKERVVRCGSGEWNGDILLCDRQPSCGWDGEMWDDEFRSGSGSGKV